jgi:hypothetical protein
MEALRDFNAALRLRPTPDLALSQAALLGRSGHPALGADHLDYFKTLRTHWPHESGMQALHRWILLRNSYWEADLVRIEAELRQDAKAEAAAHAGDKPEKA